MINVPCYLFEMEFYVPIDPKRLKREREKARELRRSNWWQQKLSEGICQYCEKKFPKDELTMDHRVPLARGGVSSKNNIVVSCKDCNSKKQSLNSVDFVDRK